jgi:hypothetical protein
MAEPPVALRAVGSAAREGRPIEIELALRDARFAPLLETELEGRARRDDGDGDATTVALAFRPVAHVPGLYRATFTPPNAGRWVVDLGGDESPALRLVAVPDDARLPADPARFASFLAAVRARGGDAVESDDAARLGSALEAPPPRREATVVRVVDLPFWPYALALLFCGEIFVRRRYGLDGDTPTAAK